jgi:hypothetical protein
MDLFSESKRPVVYIYFNECNPSGCIGGYWTQASVFNIATRRRICISLVPVRKERVCNLENREKIRLLHRSVFSDYGLLVYDAD